MIVRAVQNSRRQRNTLCWEIQGETHSAGKEVLLWLKKQTKEERRVAMTLYLFWKFPFSLNGLLTPLFPWAKLALGGTTPSFHHQSPPWNGVPTHCTGSESAHGRGERAGIKPEFPKQNELHSTVCISVSLVPNVLIQAAAAALQKDGFQIKQLHALFLPPSYTIPWLFPYTPMPMSSEHY